MIVIYSLILILIGITAFKMLNTWKLSAEMQNKKPNILVRSVFGSADFVADLVSLKVFK